MASDKYDLEVSLKYWSDTDAIAYASDVEFLSGLYRDELIIIIADMAERMEGYINNLEDLEYVDDSPPEVEDDES